MTESQINGNVNVPPVQDGTLKTNYFVDAGHEAKSEIELGNGRILKISTRKSYVGITTHASVWCSEEGGTISHKMINDYSKRIGVVNARCTAKSVALAHGTALAQLSDIKAEVDAFYLNKKEGATC